MDASAFDPTLRAPGAGFVTLERAGVLRGCVGSLEAIRPLVVDVAENAFAAAFRDPRFPPLREEERGDLRIHLTLLGPLVPVAAFSEEELVAALRPGRDGLVLQLGARRATYLPAVWDELRDPREFLLQLRRKAGIPEGGWPPGLLAWRYEVEELG